MVGGLNENLLFDRVSSIQRPFVSVRKMYILCSYEEFCPGWLVSSTNGIENLERLTHGDRLHLTA